MRKLPLLLLSWLVPIFSWAATANDSQQISQMITQTSEKVMAIVEQAKSTAGNDPDPYYQQIENTLSPIVDFDYFARAVMGHLASKRYIQTLPENEQAPAKQHIADFTAALRTTLIKSYGKTFLNFAGSKVELQSVELLGNPNQASVIQKVTDSGNQQYAIQYSLKKISNQWKIQNLIVEGINMGQSYRAQFSAALDVYKGNVGDVVEHWPEIMSQNEKQ